MIKICKGCQLKKPLTNFYKFSDRWSGKKYYSSRCKPCHLKQTQANPNLQTNRKTEKLKLRYGLTYEQWEKLRKLEKFACMICGLTESEMGKKLDVDHCHSSGKVRGVLCNPCNRVIGMARDNINILKAAIKYLKINGGGYKD